MIIEEKFKNAVNEAINDGYELLGRVQVYYHWKWSKDGQKNYASGGRPYLVGKKLGNITIIKIVNARGVQDVISLGKKSISVNDSDDWDDIDAKRHAEIIEVNSAYVCKDQNGKEDEFLFRNPY